MSNNVDDIYGNDSINIYEEVFNKDFDEVGFEPEIVDDSDNESAELYGYNN